ncbi:MAG: hypothetical protein IT385_30350 [Deltaproteobacteria bacterium]|nr:hypothetical protein [Deltaproteobacteria bacterium]
MATLLAFAALPGAVARAVDPDPAALAAFTGASPCTLIEGLPAPTHPLRKNRVVGPALAALDKAGMDPIKAGQAYARFVKEIDRLLVAATTAFKAPAPGRSFAPAPARRFLEAHVLAANAPLRVGLERFEPAPEVLAAMTLAACRAGRLDEVVRLARTSTLPESAPQRAFAALVLAGSGRHAEARELDADMGDEGFLPTLVRAELAADPRQRGDLHALAGKRRKNADQELAWRLQAQRFTRDPAASPRTPDP